MSIRAVMVITVVALAACGGGGSSQTSADPATQAVLTDISQKAAAEAQQVNSLGQESVEGVRRNAQVLKATVLNSP